MKNKAWTIIYALIAFAPGIALFIYCGFIQWQMWATPLWAGGEIVGYFSDTLVLGSTLWFGWFALITYALWDKAWQPQ